MQSLKKIIALLGLCFVFFGCIIQTQPSVPDTTPPAKLMSVASSVTATSVTFTWTNPSDSDYASMKIFNGNTLVATVNRPTATYTVTGLTQGTTYTFKFVSVDTNGNESQPFQTTATPVADTTPPANLTNVNYTFADNQKDSNKTDMTFSWTNPSDPDYDKMEIYCVELDQTFTKSKPLTGFTLTGLLKNHARTFIFKSVDTSGNKSSGYEMTVLAGSNDRTPPAKLTSVTYSVTGTSVTFTWTNPSDSDYASMKIYNGSTLVATVNKPAATYTVTGLNSNTTYTFKFVSVDTSFNESQAFEKIVTTPIPVSGLTLNKSVIVLGKGETATLYAEVSPNNASNPAVTWTSSNSGISVSNNGTISATNAGVATITATADGKTATATVLVLNTSSSYSYVASSDLTTLTSDSDDWFAGYVTEAYDDENPENGQIAYKITSDGKIDVIGYDGEEDGVWLASTHENSGWAYKLNDANPISLNSDGKYSNGTLSLSVIPVIVKEGTASNAVPYLLLVNALTNTGDTILTRQKFGCGADIDILEDYNTPVYITDSGVKSVNSTNKMVFLLDCLSGESVTPVNTLYVGEYSETSPVMNKVYADQRTSIIDGDGVIACSWQNVTLNPGETKLFTIRLSFTQDKRGSLDAIVY